jgi:hypothetical protein
VDIFGARAMRFRNGEGAGIATMATAAKLVKMPTLAEILREPDKAVSLTKEAIPHLRGELARLDTILLSRLLSTDGTQEDARPRWRSAA